MVQRGEKGTLSSKRPNGDGTGNRRQGRGRRDESQDRRKNDRRKGDRRRSDRRRMRRRETHCPVCGKTLTQNDFCLKCKARMIRIRSRS